MNRYNGDAWSGWSQLGDRETFSGPQAAVYHDRLLLVIRSGSGNQRIYRRWFDGNNWGGWSQVPGNGLTPSAPHPIVYRDRVHLFVRGTDNAIYQNRYDGSSWSGWSQVAGGGLTTRGARRPRLEGPDQPVRARDGRTASRSTAARTGRGAGGPRCRPSGLTPSGPAAIGYGPVINLVVRGTDNRIYWNRLLP